MRILKTTTARGGNLSVRVIPVYSNQLIGQFLPIVDRRKSLLYSAVYNREVMIYQKIVTLFCQNLYQIYSRIIIVLLLFPSFYGETIF